MINKLLIGVILLIAHMASLCGREGGKESSSGKKTICLNMIVKNEKEVIKRCLESVLPIIDTWVIVDTGSTDGTQEVIKTFLKDIPGDLYERPWINFGYNRQEALKLAKDKADYLLFMDADDKLIFSSDFKLPELTQDFYAIVTKTNDVKYCFQRLGLVKASLDWYWEGVIHEDLLCKSNAKGAELAGVECSYIHDGARSKDPNTNDKEIKLLEEALKTNPNNSRYVFYLAKGYAGANKFDLALNYYQQRCKMQGPDEEIFFSKIEIGKIQEALNFDAKTIENSYFQAYLCRPHRAEPLYYLVKQLWKSGDYEKAYQIVHCALELPSSVNDFMFQEQWIYDYGLLLQLAVCCTQTGRLSEGIETCKKLLARTDLPERFRKDTAVCFESLHQQNIKRIQDKLTQLLQ